MKKRKPMRRSKPRKGWGTGWGYHMRKWRPGGNALFLSFGPVPDARAFITEIVVDGTTFLTTAFFTPNETNR